MDVLGIVLTVFGIFLAILMYVFPPDALKKRFKKKCLVSYIKKLNLRDRHKIAIVDDEIESYPIDYIRNLNYDIKCFESISFCDTQELLKYDVILLDVKGVVKEDLDEGGAKLLKILKDTEPRIPIISVSSGYFHTELNEYFKLSDSNIRKPIDEYKIMEILTDLSNEFFDANEIANTISQSIENLQIKKSKKNFISKNIIEYMSNNINPKEMKALIHQNTPFESQNIIHSIEQLKHRIEND